jgi:hypothetical protein
MNQSPFKTSRIPDHRIDQFQKLVLDKWGIELTKEESQTQAESFFDLMDLVRRELKVYNIKEHD